MSMKKLYIITGANGHLGRALIRRLEDYADSIEIRGLILPGDQAAETSFVHYIKGDVRDKESLRPLFEHTNGKEVSVIHTAGIVDISEKVYDFLYDVNVNGTKNILSLCKEYQAARLLYISSVHAIPEKDPFSVLTEADHFTPDSVAGGYAKTKAEATQSVLDAAACGLHAVVVHPSGIIGPYDHSGNHLVQLITDYLKGSLPACVQGGYDFVDVRDVAEGCLLALKKGKPGECFILSNRHYKISDLLRMVKTVAGGKKLPVLPMWLAKMAVPLICLRAKRKKKRPLYTSYSLSTLQSNDRFSHEKATCELGYRPRDLYQTVKDTVQWYKTSQKKQEQPTEKKRRYHLRKRDTAY